MIEEFKKYVDNYDTSIKQIRKKYEHSLRVMNLANKYATLLNLNEEEIQLAALIGLLHDIGRFEQFSTYHTFNDLKSIDHASYGVKILFKDNIIDRFKINKENYDIIAFAILNHNKLLIENNYKNDKMLNHAKLIRDVDKIDIIYQAGKLHSIKMKATNEEVSPKVLECIKNHQSIAKKDLNNKNDKIAMMLAFAFDINYDVCLKEMKNNIISFYEKTNDTENKLKDIYEEVMKYLDYRINNQN